MSCCVSLQSLCSSTASFQNFPVLACACYLSARRPCRRNGARGPRLSGRRVASSRFTFPNADMVSVTVPGSRCGCGRVSPGCVEKPGPHPPRPPPPTSRAAPGSDSDERSLGSHPGAFFLPLCFRTRRSLFPHGVGAPRAPAPHAGPAASPPGLVGGPPRAGTLEPSRWARGRHLRGDRPGGGGR